MLKIPGIALLLLLVALTGCAGNAPRPDPMAAKVAQLVDETTNEDKEAAAFAALQNLGSESAPYLVQHLADMRQLPDPTLELENGPGSFEGIAHYRPKVVHDALSAILNGMTGQHFEDVHNGATDDVRTRNRAEWTAWCVASYPQRATICRNDTGMHSVTSKLQTVPAPQGSAGR